MAQVSSRGGCIALFATLIAVGIGVVLAGYIVLRRSSVPHSVARAEARAVESRNADVIVFPGGREPSMEVPKPGEPVTRDQFIAYMIDSRATALARESFAKVADQAEVSWDLRTGDISSRDGKLVGEFVLPWVIRHGGGSRGSEVQVSCEFVEDSRESLLQLRRGDWVTIEGRLSLGSGNPAILGARLAADAAAPRAEAP